MESLTTVIIPFDNCVIFVRLLNCAELSSRFSEVAKTLDTISGIEFRTGSVGLRERWLLGPVCVRRCARVRQGRLRSFGQFTYSGHILSFLSKSGGLRSGDRCDLLSPRPIHHRLERLVPLVHIARL